MDQECLRKFMENSPSPRWPCSRRSGSLNWAVGPPDPPLREAGKIPGANTAQAWHVLAFRKPPRTALGRGLAGERWLCFCVLESRSQTMVYPVSGPGGHEDLIEVLKATVARPCCISECPSHCLCLLPGILALFSFFKEDYFFKSLYELDTILLLFCFGFLSRRHMRS